jgi:hypothetical protein
LRPRHLIRELSPLAAEQVEPLGEGSDSAAFRVDVEWVVRFPLVPDGSVDLAIIGAFCGPDTLQGLLDRLDGDGRASSSIPFLLTLRWLQDAVFDVHRGDEPDLPRLREHLARAREA